MDDDRARERRAIPAFRTMLGIVVIVFLVEAVTMGVLGLLGHTVQAPSVMLLDAAILSLIIAPPTYWLVLRPLKREYERRLRAEIQAQALGRLAITDPVTRSMNRRGIRIALRDAIARSARYSQPLSVAMADVDAFKAINDSYGHDAGDKLLEEIVAILGKVIRLPDQVGRYGGDEFLLVLPETELDAARTMAERLCAAASKAELDVGREKIQATLSIGVTELKPGEDMEQLLGRVDQAMYQAKEAGRNRVVGVSAP